MKMLMKFRRCLYLWMQRDLASMCRKFRTCKYLMEKSKLPSWLGRGIKLSTCLWLKKLNKNWTPTKSKCNFLKSILTRITLLRRNCTEFNRAGQDLKLISLRLFLIHHKIWTSPRKERDRLPRKVPAPEGKIYTTTLWLLLPANRAQRPASMW